MSWGMRQRRRLTPEEKAANEEARRLRNAAAMHCQVCGRDILAKTGAIAHHGYERPYGEGWQTASCYGARQLPYEADRRVLGEYIEIMRTRLESMKTVRKRIAAEEVPVQVRFKNDWRDNEDQCYAITRQSFNDVRAKHENAFRRIGWDSFDTIRDRDLGTRDQRIEWLAHDLKNQQRRFDSWKLTHAFDESAKVWAEVTGAA
jgi:hypothetical protein